MASTTTAPPKRPSSSTFNPDPGTTAWVTSLTRYLHMRRRHVDPHQPTAIMEWLRLQYLRTQIPIGRQDRRRGPDAFGLHRPLQRTFLNWAARIASAEGQLLGSVRIEATGTEALTFAIPFNLQSNRSIQLQLPTTAATETVLHCWPVWQSRMQINRWRVGAVVLGINND